jgi:hypothetical protein
MFPNKRKKIRGVGGGGGELVFIFQAPVNERCVVVRFLLMQYSGEKVIAVANQNLLLHFKYCIQIRNAGALCTE